jgi:hypothetical protein
MNVKLVGLTLVDVTERASSKLLPVTFEVLQHKQTTRSALALDRMPQQHMLSTSYGMTSNASECWLRAIGWDGGSRSWLAVEL